MANRLKKIVQEKEASPEVSTAKVEEEIPEWINEVEESIKVSEVIKDERTFKLLGILSVLFSLFLFVAFTSYLFTWQEDQDKVHQFGIKVFTVKDVKILNLFGVLGAYISHFFIYNGFGLASYFLCSTLFIIGINLLLSQKVFSVFRNLKYVVTGLLIFSTALALFSAESSFSFGGAVGEWLSEWLKKWIGFLGATCLLVFIISAYFVWRFNPKFSFNWKNKVQDQTDLTTEQNPAADFQQVEKLQEPQDAQLYIDSSLPTLESNHEEFGQEILPSVGNKMNAEINPLDLELHVEYTALPQLEIVEIKEDMDVFQTQPLPEEAIPNGIGNNNEALVETNVNSTQETSEVKLDVKTAFEPYVELPANFNNDELDFLDFEADDKSAKKDEEEIQDEAQALEILPVAEETILKPKEIKQQYTPVITDPYNPNLDLSDYKYPTLDLLETHGSERIIHDPAELEANKNQIIATLKNYDITIQRIAATVGPTVTLYEIVPAPGIRISKIKNLEDDIALSLAALGIRIIAPIPGKGTIGIEVPNVRKTIVSMKTLLSSEKFQKSNFSLPIAIGKKIDNENFIVDLAGMPHLLMAGATGQGKSVGINTLLVSLLYKKHPSELKFVLVDPKKVELSLYKVIEKHFLAKLPGEEDAIITDTKKVIYTLNALCIEMDNRYDLLKEAGCRNIKEYNEKFIARRLNPQKGHQYLPFIVLVVDEFADLIMTAGKEVETPIARLAQLARAIGIHLIIATQRPSVNIITGTIKANFPARIAFRVSSKIDSRTILDAGGAEQLIGKGDMLVHYNGETVRLQCAFVDTPEVERVCEFIGDQRGYPEAFLLPEYVDEKDLDSKGADLSADRDPLFADAARLIVQNQMGSTSLIQRRMKLGYNRAGRLMDQLESAGIVGPNLGSKAREVRFKSDGDLEEYLATLGIV